MATTHIAIELMGDAQIKFTVNGKEFTGFYGEPLRKKVAVAALEGAHFDEIFSIKVKTQSDGAQLELTQFKEVLTKEISKIASENLNLTIEGQDPNNRNEYLDRSREMQMDILREAKVAADDIAASGKIAQKELQEAAKTSSPSELLKAKASIETFTQKEKQTRANISEGMGGALGILSGSLIILIAMLIFAPLVMAIVPGVGLAIGILFVLINAGEAGVLEKKHPAKLLKKLKRLDPDFVATLGPTPQLEPKVETHAAAAGLASTPVVSGPVAEASADPKQLKTPKV